MDEQPYIDEHVRHALKMLKAIGGNAKRSYENHLFLALSFRGDSIARSGEAWHQLALQSIERTDYTQAMERFGKAKASVDPIRQPLAYARILRDEAWFAAYHQGEVAQGVALIAKALAAHHTDLDQARSSSAKAKGRKQLLICQTYSWRIACLTGSDPQTLGKLLQVIEHEGREFHERDQLTILKFLIPRVSIDERVRLQLRASQLNLAHHSLLKLPYRTVRRSIDVGLSPLRWLTDVTRKE